MGFHRFSIPFLHSQNSVLIYLAGFSKDKPHGSFYHEQPVLTRPHSVTCLIGSKTFLDHIFNVSLISKARNDMFINIFCLSSFSCSIVSNLLRPHGLQHARLPCPSPTSGVYSNSCPLSR